MHDFLLAKEIIDETLRIAKEKNLANVQGVDVEIGTITLAHDGFEEPARNASHSDAGGHAEDISLENLQFGLQSIAKDTILKDTQFNIQKITGGNWKITNITI